MPPELPLLSRRELARLLAVSPFAARLWADAPAEDISLFDGHSLKNWRASEHPAGFTVADGCIVASGPRAHLYYTGPHADCRNFELTAEVLTRPHANSGLYFHTAFQPSGWPRQGFEVQIANSYPGENKKTGSLYGVRNIARQFVPDNQWFTLKIVVRGKRVTVQLNHLLLVDYTEPAEPFRADPNFDRTLRHGTFALQAHDANSTTLFRNLRLRPLPDNLPAEAREAAPTVDENYRELMRLGAENFPVVDYHVHLKGGLTLEQALANSRRLGIFYGIAVNCGLNFPVHDDQSVREYLATMQDQPCYVALQGEGREWMTLTSPESIARFDYCFTDASTFRDDTGYRRRLYIAEEMGDLSQPETFMEMYVKRIETILREPVDLYANPTFLPKPLQPRYDELWTEARMDRVIHAALEQDVAIEINNRYRIPGPIFLRRAQKAGAKFSFGTNNAEAEVGRMEYAIQMIRACNLRPEDIWTPKPDGLKPVQVKRKG